MKQKHINRLNAASVVVSFCEDTASETAGIARFAPLVASIKSEIVITQGYNRISAAPAKGVTENLVGIRERMMQHTFELGSAVYSFAACLATPDYDLMAQAKVTIDQFERLSKEKCANHCDRICKLAASHAADIAPYGATVADIAAAQGLVTLYMNDITHPRAAIITRGNAVRQANLHLTHIMNTLLRVQLDSMANTLRFKNKPWWNKYYMSRAIIDLGQRHTKLHVYAHDPSGVPVKGANAFLMQNGKAVYTKKAAPEGLLSFMRIKAGDYELRVEKKGLVAYTEEGLHISPGKELTRTIMMLPG
ncbi:MAG: carboxypeptidase-like regulatory domain-containing protein [Bacteroidota bacterium]